MLVLTACAAGACTDISATGASCTALELLISAVDARDGALFPTSALRVPRHWIGEAACLAALATRSLARIAAALAPVSACEAVLAAVAAYVARSDADVAATRTASATLKLVALGIDASDRVACASISFGDGVRGATLPCLTALASRGRTRVSAATATLLAREEIAILVSAAEVALSLAHITATLPVAARERMALAIDAHLHVPKVEVLRDVPMLLPLDCQ